MARMSRWIAAGAWIGLSAGCGWLQPGLDVSYTSTGVQLAQVSGATRMPMRSFYLASVEDGTGAATLPEGAVMACAEGRDVSGQLPLSAMLIEAAPGSEVRVAGRAIGSLDAEGRFPPADLKGMLHAPLYDQLLEHAETAKELAQRGCNPTGTGATGGAGGGGGFEGRVLLVLDQRLPFQTVVQLLYTAGQAQFSDLVFLVEDEGASLDRFAALATPPSATLEEPLILLDGDGYHLTAPGLPPTHRVDLLCEGGCSSLEAYPVDRLQTMLSAMKPAAGGSGLVVSPTGGLPWALVARTLGAARRSPTGDPLFSELVLAGSDSSAGPSLQVPERPVTPLHLDLDSEVTVLRLTLPSLGPGLHGEPRADQALLEKMAELSGAGPLPEPTPDPAGNGGSGGMLGVIGPSGRPDGGILDDVFDEPPRPGPEPVVQGNLDKDSVQAVIRRHMAQIRYCYQRELMKRPDLGGRIEVQLTIGPDGAVSAARIAESSLGSEAVESCIQRRFERMRFPEPEGGGSVVVSYPFVFEPA